MVDTELLEVTYADMEHIKNCLLLLDDLTDDLNAPITEQAKGLLIAAIRMLTQTSDNFGRKALDL